ncbi:hypothetical protein CLCR_09120 [Cladophialophora carrionii]|uniref:Uncharacterized protein n=1 Tax=Cladophialophora carrionii TaxID=86049 RepID=A0A1C1CUT8_9EURO|nr:hypothetical protein CLCR_09120 [Cladophialophora carrionii]
MSAGESFTDALPISGQPAIALAHAALIVVDSRRILSATMNHTSRSHPPSKGRVSEYITWCLRTCTLEQAKDLPNQNGWQEETTSSYLLPALSKTAPEVRQSNGSVPQCCCVSDEEALTPPLQVHPICGRCRAGGTDCVYDESALGRSSTRQSTSTSQQPSSAPMSYGRTEEAGLGGLHVARKYRLSGLVGIGRINDPDPSHRSCYETKQP